MVLEKVLAIRRPMYDLSLRICCCCCCCCCFFVVIVWEGEARGRFVVVDDEEDCFAIAIDSLSVLCVPKVSTTTKSYFPTSMTPG